MKKGIVLFLLFLLFTVPACTKKTKYGEWDGNYIYFYNYRIKTDGTEKTKSIDSFSDGNHTYQITDNNLYGASYYGDYVFLTVTYQPQEDEIEEDVLSIFVPRALLLYNIKEKTSRYIFSTGVYGEYCTSFSVLYCFENYFVVSRTTTEQETLYTVIDYLGNILDEDDPIYRYNIVGDAVFLCSDGYVSYCTLDNREFRCLFEYKKDSFYVRNITGDLYVCDDVVFDPVARKYAVIPWEEGSPHITLDKYFIFCSAETWDTFVYRDVRLYRINEDCTFELLLTLPDGLFSDYPSCDGKYIGFRCRKQRDDKMTDYTYNVQNGKFYCGTATIKGEINDVHNVTNGVRCGKYYYNYYSRPALIGSYVGFARYDSETQETVEMNVMDKLRLSANRSRNTAFIVKPY